MNKIKKIFLLVHISVWIMASTFIFWIYWNDGNPNWIPTPTGIITTGLYVFYTHFFILTRYFNKRKYKAYLWRLIFILFTGPFPFMLFIGKIMLTGRQFLEYYGASLLTVVLFFFVLSFLTIITQNLIINTIKKEQLEKQAVQAELIYLKSQINPHFLFNTLNNIHTLVYKQAPAAPEAVMRLSSLMRYMIYESNASTVPLSKEINYLEDYIGLQQLRYKTTSIVDFQVEGDIENCQIAPLLFIHLLENAYKHSPARLEPGSIKVRVAVKENVLTLTIQNPSENKRVNLLEEQGGVGLPNVQKRLQLLYPNQHSLVINQIDEVFTVDLKISEIHKQDHERKAHLLYN